MKSITMETIHPRKRTAMEMVCESAFYTNCAFAIGLLGTGIVLPLFLKANQAICWISMGLEAMAFMLGYLAFWIKRYAL